MEVAELPPDLTTIARTAMAEHNLVTDFTDDVLKETENIKETVIPPSPHYIDLRDKLWFSLDNDESKDLDQLTYAEKLPDDKYKIYIAIADVDSLVKKNSPIDRFAQKNTTSVYTPTKVFSMLPEKLSTHLTSLNENEDRLAIIVEIEVNQDGSLGPFKVYEALVRNKAKLAYNSIANWLDGKSPMPEKVKKIPLLEEQVRLQDYISQLLKSYRHYQGSLTLETIDPQPEIKDNKIVDIKQAQRNRARDLIEEFMIAANTSIAKFLRQHDLPSLRRVVRVPKRWDRILELAKERGEDLPTEPDAKSLDLFLIKERLLDPLRFPDLSLAVIKLLGNGEYIVEYPNEDPVGHFSLALKDYTHSTAPNRRYPDLITQRMVKAALQNQPSPYNSIELENLAKRMTQKEDEATKVERQMKKSASILLLQNQINHVFDAIVTGAGSKGTWVRVLHPPVEGKLIRGYENVDVGDRIKVRLVHIDMEKGFIDFEKAQ
jgi:exoribonuclease II